jgi:hypothetical protein
MKENENNDSNYSLSSNYSLNLENKYKELVERLNRIEDDNADALAKLEEHCPSSVTKFIETFAAEFGARAVTYIVFELLMKGLK